VVRDNDCVGNGRGDVLSGSSRELNEDPPPNECRNQPGDQHCDGRVDFDDIDACVLALGGAAAYQAAYPDCQWLNGDCDGNGTVNCGASDALLAVLSGRGG